MMFDFVKWNTFYFGRQETLVDKQIFSYSDNINFHYSLDGTKDTYFPLIE